MSNDLNSVLQELDEIAEQVASLIKERDDLKKQCSVWERTCDLIEKQKSHALELLYDSKQEVAQLKKQLEESNNV